MHYYTTVEIAINGKSESRAIGLASFYGPRHEELYSYSSGTYWTAQKTDKLEFIPAEAIKQLVMMAPDPRYGTYYKDGTEKDRFYMMQKPGGGLLDTLGLTKDTSAEQNAEEDEAEVES